jgi:hypothetical protein
MGVSWLLVRAGLAAFVAVAALWALRRATARTIPRHLLGNPHVFVPDLFSTDTAAELLTLAKELESFPTNVADLRFYSTANEHIGEAVDAEEDGSCAHPFLVPNSARTQCVLPGRIDIGKHYILSGGLEGLKESYASLVSRVQSFGAYLFDLDSFPQVRALFESDRFQQAARAVCPPEKQVLDPFQFNLILNVPGQTVATHIDGAYFWGANRFYFPQWYVPTSSFPCGGLRSVCSTGVTVTWSYVHTQAASCDGVQWAVRRGVHRSGAGRRLLSPMGGDA